MTPCDACGKNMVTRSGYFALKHTDLATVCRPVAGIFLCEDCLSKVYVERAKLHRRVTIAQAAEGLLIYCP